MNAQNFGNESREVFPCPAQGNKCETCVRVAKIAMNDALVRRGRYSEISAYYAVEDTPVEDLVQSVGVSDLSCQQRRDRAAKVGVDAAINRAKNNP